MLFTRFYSTNAVPPNLWTPQNSQTLHPFRPIDSSRGEVTYGVAEELADIFRQVVVHFPHTSETTNTL